MQMIVAALAASLLLSTAAVASDVNGCPSLSYDDLHREAVDMVTGHPEWQLVDLSESSILSMLSAFNSVSDHHVDADHIMVLKHGDGDGDLYRVALSFKGCVTWINSHITVEAYKDWLRLAAGGPPL